MSHLLDNIDQIIFLLNCVHACAMELHKPKRLYLAFTLSKARQTFSTHASNRLACLKGMKNLVDI